LGGVELHHFADWSIGGRITYAINHEIKNVSGEVGKLTCGLKMRSTATQYELCLVCSYARVIADISSLDGSYLGSSA